jgi:hypothetical protein
MDEKLRIKLKCLLEHALSDDICDECIEKIANSIIELLKQKIEEE